MVNDSKDRFGGCSTPAPLEGETPRDQPRVLLLGASCRAMATSARRAGWTPLCADSFCDRDLYAPGGSVRIRDYPSSINDDLAQLRADAWCYTGGLENEPEIIASLEGQSGRLGPLWGVAANALLGCRDPFRVAALWRACGLSVPELLPVDCPPPRDGNWLIKPVRGSGGWLIKKWIDRSHQVSGEVELLPGNVYFQRQIPGESFSALFLVTPKPGCKSPVIQLVAISQQILGPGTFRFAGAITPVELPESALEQVELALRVVADTSRLTGLIGVDFLFDGARVWPLEINPRYTASVEVVELSRQLPLLAWHQAACEGRDASDLPLPQLGSQPQIVGKQIVYARQPCVLVAEPATNEFESGYEIPAVADISPAGTEVNIGDPVCTVFASARSVATCREELQRRSLTIWEWYVANCPGEAPLRAGRS